MNQTQQLKQSLNLACKLAPSLGHCQVVPGHLLLVLLEDKDIAFLLNAYGVDIKEAKTSILKLFPGIQPRQAPNDQKMPVSDGLAIVLEHASASAGQNGFNELDSTFVFATLLREGDSPFSSVLDDYDLSYESVTQFMELQTGSTVTIGAVPAYTIPDAAYNAPAPTAAPAMPAAAIPARAAPSMAAPRPVPEMAQPEQAAPAQMAPPDTRPGNRAAAPPARNEGVISFSNIQKRQEGTPEPVAVQPSAIPPDMPPQNLTGQAAPGQQPPAGHAAPISKPAPQQGQAIPQQGQAPSHAPSRPAAPVQPIQQPVQQAATAPAMSPVSPQQQVPQTSHSTVSATGSVIEKGILVFAEHIDMKMNRPQIVEVRIARNPGVRVNEEQNASYDRIVMEALTTQLHAPGQNFHIKSLLPETHWLDNDVRQAGDADYGKWKWEVTPLQRGQTQLSLVVSSRTLDKDNQLASVTLPEKSMGVKVGMNTAALMLKLVALAIIAGLGIAAALFLPKLF